ncbi:MAG: hypothetical protein NVSMB3_04780 [Acidobacteriaceae bacterium]
MFEQTRECGLDRAQGAEKVKLHGALEGGEGLVFDGADLDDACVVDENVDAAEVLEGEIDEGFGLRWTGEVCGDEKDVVGCRDGTLIKEGLAGAGELVRVAGGEDEAAAGATETMGESEAETSGAAGDDDDGSGTRRAGARCRLELLNEKPGGRCGGDAG